MPDITKSNEYKIYKRVTYDIICDFFKIVEASYYANGLVPQQNAYLTNSFYVATEDKKSISYDSFSDFETKASPQMEITYISYGSSLITNQNINLGIHIAIFSNNLIEVRLSSLDEVLIDKTSHNLESLINEFITNNGLTKPEKLSFIGKIDSLINKSPLVSTIITALVSSGITLLFTKFL